MFTKTLIAAALAAVVAVPAQAAVVGNGTHMNGTHVNGVDLNGVRTNGIHINGIKVNGVDLNGVRANGTHLNGIRLNGVEADVRTDGVRVIAIDLLPAAPQAERKAGCKCE